MIFQEPMSSLNPVYTCGFQIVEAIRQHEDISKSAARRKAASLLQEVNLLPRDEEFRQQYIQDILKNSALHGGCELLRRLMGIVSVYDLSSIEDENVRVIAERQALHIARKWLTIPITDASQLAELASQIILNA